ncbi:MAG TPA: hypothetical protein VFA59_18425 [Vicinamibacterales bacterium]|nr:hypothetical protein [Vicinamibacterales bacterium]
MSPQSARNRFLSRTIAVALAFVVCGGALDWGHLGGDDADCNVVYVAHDHAAHRFAANPNPNAPAPEHCYICHSLRLLHSAVAAQQQRAVIDLQIGLYRNPIDAAASQRVGVHLSSRAPPSVSL